jgi:hypothetical protein
VVVANEMSGLRDKVLRKKRSQSSIADAYISNASPGAENKDQESHHTSHDWINQLESGGGNPGKSDRPVRVGSISRGLAAVQNFMSHNSS